VFAWILTIPMAGGFAAIFFFIIKAIHHIVT
jgi:phosphate/sulfate permease